MYFKNAQCFPCDSTQSAARLITDCHTLLNAELVLIYLHSYSTLCFDNARLLTALV
jgi:hypothetical protein